MYIYSFLKHRGWEITHPHKTKNKTYLLCFHKYNLIYSNNLIPDLLILYLGMGRGSAQLHSFFLPVEKKKSNVKYFPILNLGKLSKTYMKLE